MVSVKAPPKACIKDLLPLLEVWHTIAMNVKDYIRLITTDKTLEALLHLEFGIRAVRDESYSDVTDFDPYLLGHSSLLDFTPWRRCVSLLPSSCRK